MDEFDAVIIGSGAGGAPIAYDLARAGKRVLVLEKGPWLGTQDDSVTGLSDFKRDELYGYGFEKVLQLDGVANKGQPYFPSHVEPDLNDEPHIYTGLDEANAVATIEGYTAQVIGGGTQLYGGVQLRFTEDDFRLASVTGARQFPGNPMTDPEVSIIDWPVTYQQLEPFYEKTERLIGVNGTVANQAKPFITSPNPYQAPLSPNPISEFARAGMQALGMTQYRTPLAVITEDHAPSGRKAGNPKTSYVNRYGDPLGLKSNTWVALLRPTLRDPQAGPFLTIRCNSQVTHLSADGAVVTGVHYRDAGGTPRSVRGKVVVVACSAIESVRLLMISAEEDPGGIGARLRYGLSTSLLGRYFMTHCFGGAETVVQVGRYDKSVSLDSDYATDACATRAFAEANGIWAGGAIYNNTSDQALPLALARTHGSVDLDTLWTAFADDTGLISRNLTAWLNADFGTRLSTSFMANQVPWFRNHVRLHHTTDKWGRKNAHIVKDWHPHDRVVMDVLAQRCAAILDAGGTGASPGSTEFGSVKDQGVRIANHIIGGARMGTSADTSVVDASCRVWELDNLYVTDGACFPSAGGANPTNTIQANAFRVAGLLASRI
jgi:choline dehydrogenase-like flavoprotein